MAANPDLFPLGSQENPILIKQNDTRPKIRAAVWQGADRTPVPLTGGTVVFNMRTVAGVTVANRQGAAIIDGSNGITEYTLKTSETGTIGTFNAEFEATLSDGGILTVPDGPEYIWITISDDIA